MPQFSPDVASYALFPGQGKLSDDRRNIDSPPSEILGAGLEFTLRLECWKCTEEQINAVQEALRWWANFGGIGARTRRGLGSVQVEGCTPVTVEEASQFGCELKKKNTVDGAIKAWKQAVEALQNFRQDPVGRRAGRPRPGRSYWPEAGTIRAITRYRVKEDGTSFAPAPNDPQGFPRAAFGLPIVFHFQNVGTDSRPDPGDCEIKPVGKDRMASPLILKARVEENGKFAPIALRLPTAHLRNLQLELVDLDQNPNLPQTFDRDTWWPTDKKAAQERADYPNSPMKNRGQDALSAFLAYFSLGSTNR